MIKTAVLPSDVAPVTIVAAAAPKAPVDALVKGKPNAPVSFGPFLYREDVLPTAIIGTGVALSLAPFFVPMSVGAAVALGTVGVAMRVLAPLHQHHHAHLGVFTNKVLNRAYDAMLMLAGGNLTSAWVQQHVRGHHASYLDHENDVAGTKRFTKSGPLRKLIFTVAGDAMSFVDAWRIAGTSHRPGMTRAKLAGDLAVQVAANGALLALNPVLAASVFIVPNALLRLMVFWESFEQHDKAPAHDAFDGSMNNRGPISRMLLNVGDHTAHHVKPTLHWSRLPALTEKLGDKIPPECFR